jgi:predicted NACHT family NTPase
MQIGATMAAHFYNWKRFWSPRTSQINLADGGYLPDPEGQWTRFHNPDLVPFESIGEVPCLGLLGEPGIGKSFALGVQRSAIEAKIKEQGGETVWLDLHQYSSEDMLVRDLFESPTFTAWAMGSHCLHVFLDSLDECLMRVGTVAAIVVNKLRSCPRDRLYLRITCRTADWPNSLENGLTEFWGEQAAKVYELAPLRRVDVIEAASANGLNADALLEAIDRAGAVPLAIKPITLQFLLNTFSRSRQLPSKQADLYLEGCQLLCEETNEERRDAGLAGNLTAKQRMAVAGRIAAVTLFANRAAVWTGVDKGDVPLEDVVVEELSGGTVNLNGDEFAVTESAARETLGTGLFTSRGPKRMGWAHQTYAEFLAARFLMQQKMTLPQRMSLLVHPDDPEQKLVPQLHGVTAWLAAMDPKVFDEVSKTDPDVLLLSDVLSAEEASRAALVESFLRMIDERRIQFPGFGTHWLYRKLAHPNLATQLRAFIRDQTKSLVARREAMDIAVACEVKALQDDFATIALDQSQALELRKPAAFAVARFGDSATRARMKPLATGEAGDDPEDELKGCGLRAVWPEHMTASELVTFLTPPKRTNLYGAYRAFLRNELVNHLRAEDLPLALTWTAEQITEGAFASTFEELADEIMSRAWEHLESPEVLDSFARTAVLRLERRYAIGGDTLTKKIQGVSSADGSKRRSLVRAMVPLFAEAGKAVVSLCYDRTPLVRSDDAPWMIEELLGATSANTKRVWARLIRHVFDWRVAGQFEAVIAARNDEPLLAEEFSWLLEPVVLGSPEAQRMKEGYLEAQKWQEGRSHDRPLVEPPPQERIAVLLDRFESGDVSAWWRLNLAMTPEPDRKYPDDFELDLRELPGWKAAADPTRARAVAAAKQYIIAADPETPTWLGTNLWHRPAVAGYRALKLLLAEDPAFVESIPPNVWEKWAPTVLAYFPLIESQADGLDLELLKRAYSSSPESVAEALIKLIDKENKGGNYIFITRRAQCCWDERLAAALAAKVRDQNLNPTGMNCLLSDLLDHGVAEARAYAESLIRVPSATEGDERLRAVLAAATLLTHTEDAAWGSVWPAVLKDRQFGREVFSRIASEHYDGGIPAQRLNEDQLGELYVWLARQYPHADDPRFDDAHAVGPREMLGHFRDGILAYLKSRGTNKACEAIQRVAEELPELEWLSWTLAEARAVTRQRTWVPPKPEDIIKLAGDWETRLVQSGDQLLEVLIESLERLETELQGETPAAEFLWDKVSKGIYRPKDENSLSNYIKRHLEKDLEQKGIVANREVQIRRGTGGASGESTDIHVDAVVPRGAGAAYDKVSVIIEVKGCWHAELETAMEAQLVDRYLRDKQCQHGLYVVGWFNCPQWDPEDSRHKQAPKYEIEEARRGFEAQAVELSQGAIRVKAFLIDTALR